MHLLIPDILVAPEAVRDIVAALGLPGLVQLLGYGRLLESEGPQAELDRAMPATHWLLRAFHVPSDGLRPPLGPLMLLGESGKCTGTSWFALQPCHFALARDHVQLGDYALDVTPAESSALLAAARESLCEPETELLTGSNGSRWYYHHPALEGLLTSEPARSLGRNIEIWLPENGTGLKTDAARHWRKLHNEVQMIWHAHPVNAAREARGQATVNALWLFGGAALPAHQGESAPAQLALRPGQDLFTGLASWSKSQTVPRTVACDALVVLDELSDAATREDWTAWRSALLGLEQTWFAPLALQRRPLTISLCAEHGWRTWEHRPRRAWQLRPPAPITRLLCA